MRLWHLAFAVVVIALILTICQEPAGRVAVVVFFTTIGEVFFGTTALLALFRTVGAFGEAKGLFAHAEALIATLIVLALATFLMSGTLFAGVWLVRASVY